MRNPLIKVIANTKLSSSVNGRSRHRTKVLKSRRGIQTTNVNLSNCSFSLVLDMNSTSFDLAMASVENSATYTRLSLLFLIGTFVFLGNILCLVVFLRTRRLRTRPYYLVVCLCLIDLMVGLTTLGRTLEDAASLWFSRRFNPVISLVFVELNVLLLTASISTIASISVERLWAVVLPLHHRTAVLIHYIPFIAVPWLVSATNSCLELLALFDIITWYPFLHFYQVIIVVICVTIFGSYLGIYVKQKCRKISDSGRNTLRDRKLAGTVFLVAVASFVTWFPISVYYQTLTYQEKISSTVISSNKIFLFLAILSICNSGVNVVVYMFRIPDFRRAAKSIICKCCSRSRRSRINVQNISRRKPPSRNANSANTLAQLDCDCIVISGCPNQLGFDISGSSTLSHCQEAVGFSGAKGKDKTIELFVIPVVDVTGSSSKHSAGTPSLNMEDSISFYNSSADQGVGSMD